MKKMNRRQFLKAFGAGVVGIVAYLTTDGGGGGKEQPSPVEPKLPEPEKRFIAADVQVSQDGENWMDLSGWHDMDLAKGESTSIYGFADSEGGYVVPEEYKEVLMGGLRSGKSSALLGQIHNVRKSMHYKFHSNETAWTYWWRPEGKSETFRSWYISDPSDNSPFVNLLEAQLQKEMEKFHPEEEQRILFGTGVGEPIGILEAYRALPEQHYGTMQSSHGYGKSPVTALKRDKWWQHKSLDWAKKFLEQVLT